MLNTSDQRLVKCSVDSDIQALNDKVQFYRRNGTNTKEKIMVSVKHVLESDSRILLRHLRTSTRVVVRNPSIAVISHSWYGITGFGCLSRR